MQVGVSQESRNFLIFLILDEVAQEMIRASKVWPYYTPWTLSDVKTAAWLVENDHLTQLEIVVFSSDLESTSITKELDSIRRVASKELSKPDEKILIKPKGLDIFCYFSFISLTRQVHSKSCVQYFSTPSLTNYQHFKVKTNSK